MYIEGWIWIEMTKNVDQCDTQNLALSLLFLKRNKVIFENVDSLAPSNTKTLLRGGVFFPSLK